MKIIRTTNSHPDFRHLTAKLDAELHTRYGSAQDSYDQHNVIEPIDTAIIGYVDDQPVACGCFKILNASTVEIKRMFVVPQQRRKGFAVELLDALEEWAAQKGFAQALLETGKGQPEAINLYRKMGYELIDNYGPYVGRENSVCLAKRLHNIS